MLTTRKLSTLVLLLGVTCCVPPTVIAAPPVSVDVEFEFPDPDNLPELEDGFIRVPFDITVEATGATAIAAKQAALQKVSQAVVQAAELQGALYGAALVTVEILISEQVGEVRQDANGLFHAKRRVAGNFVFKPTQWPFPLPWPFLI